MRCIASHRCLWAGVAPEPAMRCSFAPQGRKHASSAQSQFPLARGQWGQGRYAFKFIFACKPGNEALVISWRRQDVSHTKVARLYPLTPRHPCGGNKCLLTRHQHHVIHGDGVSACCSNHQDRPVPAEVGRIEAGIQMGSNVISIHGRAHKITNKLLPYFFDKSHLSKFLSIQQ
ncbi:unannotated protein [freshwater metagenome]|uniref:Unannotated protein n=1 Tax=freshwater metagenome TaxID=449393 RepID=A0A6J6ISC1_9ZZZZ